MKTYNIINPRKRKSRFSTFFPRHICLLIIAAFYFSTVNAQSKKDYTSTSFKVYGECVECEERIENSLKIKGVKLAKWDVNTEMLSVSYDADILNLAGIQSKILAAGHDLETEKAKDEVYKALPKCCHYRDVVDEAHD
ncbi:MAG: heavy-metal-associated domain-containing protein, partial [Ginsengibacter sp.]